MDWKIPLFKMYWENDDVAAVESVIRRGMQWAIGPEIVQFEQLLAQYLGRKYAIALNSGTSALHALLLAYGLKANDEIITPSFTFIATANSALFVGAKPVFADIEEKTYALSAKDVEKRITKKTKAILPIHYAGAPAIEIQELKEIAEKYNFILIEDAAEALGAKLNNKKAGTFGHSAILSFCSNKIISTGEGGMVVTDSHEIYEKLKLIRSHGRAEENQNFFDTNRSMDYVEIGYNWRMPSFCAAIGISQLKKIDKIIATRQKAAMRFSEQLGGIATVPLNNNNLNHVFQLYSVRFNDEKTRNKVKDALGKEGIMSKIYFDPVHKTHFYKNVLQYTTSLKNTEKVSSEILSLPMFTNISNDQIDFIVEKIKSVK